MPCRFSIEKSEINYVERHTTPSSTQTLAWPIGLLFFTNEIDMKNLELDQSCL